MRHASMPRQSIGRPARAAMVRVTRASSNVSSDCPLPSSKRIARSATAGCACSERSVVRKAPSLPAPRPALATRPPPSRSRAEFRRRPPRSPMASSRCRDSTARPRSVRPDIVEQPGRGVDERVRIPGVERRERLLLGGIARLTDDVAGRPVRAVVQDPVHDVAGAAHRDDLVAAGRAELREVVVRGDVRQDGPLGRGHRGRYCSMPLAIRSTRDSTGAAAGPRLLVGRSSAPGASKCCAIAVRPAATRLARFASGMSNSVVP